MNKGFLLELLRQAYADEQALIAGLTEDERAAVGTPERWSARDLLAHIAAWKAHSAQVLAAAARGDVPPAGGEVDELNAQTFAANRDRAWDEVVADLRDAYTELAASIEALPDAALFDPQAFEWHKGEALYLDVQGNGYWHPESHLAFFYVARGDLQRAVDLQEAVAERLSGPEAGPEGESIARYNLACFYSMAGLPAKAVPLLAEAFSSNPGIVTWARQDTDLVPLHGLPEYEALYS